jgi:hypothetical protein
VNQHPPHSWVWRRRSLSLPRPAMSHRMPCFYVRSLLANSKSEVVMNYCKLWLKQEHTQRSSIKSTELGLLPSAFSRGRTRVCLDITGSTLLRVDCHFVWIGIDLNLGIANLISEKAPDARHLILIVTSCLTVRGTPWPFPGPSLCIKSCFT